MKNSITQITEKFIKNIGEIFKEAVLLQAQRICLMQRQAGTLRQTIEKYRERTGHYPTRVLADKIYRNRDNLNFCKEHGIRLSGPALGRPKKDELAYLIFVQGVTVNARKVRMFAFKPVNGYKANFSDIYFRNIPYLIYFFFDLFISHRRN